MRSLDLPHRQQGVVVLLILLVVIVSSTGLFLASANFSTRSVTEQQEIIFQMEQAKAALIAYATNYDDFQNDGDGNSVITDEGPGRFPCPDTDNDGLPNTGCTAYQHGRLPESITLTNGNTYRFSSTYAGIDRQFWYVVSPAFSQNTTNRLNTSHTGDLTLDGESGIVAVIIAPGAANASQDRSAEPTTASNYLEGSNASGAAFINSYATDPDNFNDLVLPITTNEVRTAMAYKVAQRVKYWLDYVYDVYFDEYLGSWYSGYYYSFNWLVTVLSDQNSDDLRFWAGSQDNWNSNYTYTKVSTNVATMTFTNCGITFTLTYGGGITKSQPAC